MFYHFAGCRIEMNMLNAPESAGRRQQIDNSGDDERGEMFVEYLMWVCEKLYRYAVLFKERMRLCERTE